MDLAVWLFASKAHVDLKRVLTRFGLTVHDTTTRRALKSLTESSLAKLRTAVAEDLAQQDNSGYALILDNVQQYCPTHEHCIGKAPQQGHQRGLTSHRQLPYNTECIHRQEFLQQELTASHAALLSTAGPSP